MRKQQAALGSAMFFLVAPCVVAGLVPWWITGWSPPDLPFWLGASTIVVGFGLMVGGVVLLVRAFARFVNEGRGTPAPVAPTERLVVGGEYRFVRNPMYVGVEAIILGQAALFWSAPLVLYSLVSWLGMAAFVRWYEEPVLRSRYGVEYDTYRRAVRGWWPRLRPWDPSRAAGTNS
ncbi:MAG: isoprenylcysteine carboxylmethyltransferase family protein [Pseudonocardiales bacterium]